MSLFAVFYHDYRYGDFWFMTVSCDAVYCVLTLGRAEEHGGPWAFAVGLHTTLATTTGLPLAAEVELQFVGDGPGRDWTPVTLHSDRQTLRVGHQVHMHKHWTHWLELNRVTSKQFRLRDHSSDIENVFHFLFYCPLCPEMRQKFFDGCNTIWAVVGATCFTLDSHGIIREQCSSHWIVTLSPEMNIYK